MGPELPPQCVRLLPGKVSVASTVLRANRLATSSRVHVRSLPRSAGRWLGSYRNLVKWHLAEEKVSYKTRLTGEPLPGPLVTVTPTLIRDDQQGPQGAGQVSPDTSSRGRLSQRRVPREGTRGHCINLVACQLTRTVASAAPRPALWLSE